MLEIITGTGDKYFDSGCHCGSSMFYRMHGEGRKSIAPGALDDNDMLRVRGQIFAISHPQWGMPDLAVTHLDNSHKP